MNQSVRPRPPATPSRGNRPDTPPEPPGFRAWLVLGLVLMVFYGWQRLGELQSSQPTIAYSTFHRLLVEERVERVTFRGAALTGELKSEADLDGVRSKSFQTRIPAVGDDTLSPLLREKRVRVEALSEEPPFLLQLLSSLLPLLIIVGMWVWLSRRAQRMFTGGGPFGGMLKGRTRRFEREAEVSVKFEDVAGLKSAKQDLQEIVEFLKYPERFRKMGGKVPRGVLLVGPPGTGKTLLARAVAGESGVPFFSINGSEFIEMFVGVGASRVRELFEEAKKVAPAIVFIDEIDAVGRSRGAGLGGGHDEREQTLNQLLSEMDGFSRNDLTIVLAATNRPDVLDAALLRPGRFDRRVLIDRPELLARRAILDVHVRGKPLSADVDLDVVAGNTPGFSGADLANLVNEAALGATRRGAEAIEQRDFTSAFDKIVLGDPRESKLDAEEKHRVAVHEAGHAIVAHFSEHAEPPQRVSIIPRGMALGVTQQSPGADRHVMAQPELAARLAVLMGGYAAEREVIGNGSSGAENDLKRATDIAFKMVAHFGMSERVGPVFHEHRTEHPFLGQTLATEGGTSDATVHVIEEEARRLLGAAEQTARRLITEHRGQLDMLVESLLEKETLERGDLLDLLGPPATPLKPAS
jgi:cell division protease FtsH